MKFLFLIFSLLGCTQLGLKPESQLGINSPEHLGKPIVLMISIDGYRHDYNELYKPPFLSRFAKEGVQAKGLIPVYPTNTFPNHYSLVTGLYPDHHGIVSNVFYAPDLDLHYSLRDSEAVTNGKFYGGVPLWSLARLQGMVSATYFWPGSEAEIAGVRPHYYLKYDHDKPHDDRVNTVLNWLKLPAKNRPHFVTVYFSAVDSAGHAHGPNSEQVATAVQEVDKHIERLVTEAQKLNLPLTIMIVSDHGMTALSFDKVEVIDDQMKTPDEKEAFKNFLVDGSGPFIFYHHTGEKSKKQSDLKLVLKALNRAKYFKTYQRGTLPKHLNFNKNPRMGEMVSIADPGYTIGAKNRLRVIAGMHGFDPSRSKDMEGIFMAQGPSLVTEKTMKSFENIHVYPLVAKILGLEIKEPIDGKLSVTKEILKPDQK